MIRAADWAGAEGYDFSHVLHGAGRVEGRGGRGTVRRFAGWSLAWRGAGEAILTEGADGAAAWVSLAFEQPARVKVLSKITKVINHEGHAVPRRLSEQTPFVSFCVFGG